MPTSSPAGRALPRSRERLAPVASSGSWRRRRWALRLVAAALVVLGALGLAGPAALAQQGDDPGSGSETDARDADRDAALVEILQISGPVDPPVTRAIHRLLRQSEERGSDLIIIQIDSAAGIAAEPLEVVGPIRESAVPVVVWVGHTFAQAGGTAAFLATAAHVTAASAGATLGPACPAIVDRGCTDGDRALLTDLVEDRLGADAGAIIARLADAGVDGQAAREAELTALTVEGLEPLLVELDGREVVTSEGPTTLELPPDAVSVRFHELGLLERALHAVLDADLVYLLLATTLLLLLFEVFQPGFGVAGVAAILVAPLAVYGLVVLPVAWWALALVVVGMALLAADLAIAGLGVPTVGGAVALAAGSWWLFPGDHPLLQVSPWLVALVVVTSVVFFVFIMTVVLRAQAGPEVSEVGEDLVGRVGVVRSTMNPEGHVFVAGALWRARWVGEDRGKVRTGTRVRITAADGATLLVDDPDDVPASADDRRPVTEREGV